MMLEAVIWDFGGVLTTSPFEAFARFETERGLPADIIRRTNANNHWENAWAKFERAEVDIETFDQLFAAESLALGAEVRGKDVLPLLSGDLRPEMVEALRRIGTELKTGCITNNLPANAIGSLGGRPPYLSDDGREAWCRPQGLRLPRRSGRQSQTGARNGHDHHQGAERITSDNRARNGDGIVAPIGADAPAPCDLLER